MNNSASLPANPVTAWRWLCGWLLYACTAWASAEPKPLLIPAVQPEFHIAQAYFVELLRRALVLGADGREVPQLLEQHSMEQHRGQYELARGKLLDVYWMGTNREREQLLRAIRVPLTRGLMGYRRFIIHRDQRARFDKVQTLVDLRAFHACQGTGWPDVDILRAAGLRVREFAGFDSIFARLSSGHCDYFPRGYFEADSELKQFGQQYPQLETYEALVLQYPFDVYFFVSREREDLAQWIELGLERMIDKGELRRHLQEQPLTRAMFPLRRGPLRILRIANPFLPEDTPSSNPRYWTHYSELLPK